MLRPDEMLLLCDFETTGFAQDPDTVPIQFAGLFLRNDLTIESEFNHYIQQPNLPDPIPGFEIHGITHDILNRKGLESSAVTSLINAKMHDLHRDGARAIYLCSDNVFFDQTFAYKMNLVSRQGLHYNPMGAKLLCRIAGVEKPDKFAKKHCAMNDSLNWYRSVLLAYDRIKGRSV